MKRKDKVAFSISVPTEINNMLDKIVKETFLSKNQVVCMLIVIGLTASADYSKNKENKPEENN